MRIYSKMLRLIIMIYLRCKYARAPLFMETSFPADRFCNCRKFTWITYTVVPREFQNGRTLLGRPVARPMHRASYPPPPCRLRSPLPSVTPSWVQKVVCYRTLVLFPSFKLLVPLLVSLNQNSWLRVCFLGCRTYHTLQKSGNFVAYIFIIA